MKKILNLLKMLLGVTNSAIVVLILVFSFAEKKYVLGQSISLTNDKRGMYVNNFLEVDGSGNTITAYSVLGINTKENDLLKFAQDHHIQYLDLYDMTEIFNNEDELTPIQRQGYEADLRAFISKAKQNYHILEVGAVIPSKAIIDDLDVFNQRMATTPGYTFTSQQLIDFPILQIANNYYPPNDPLAPVSEIARLALKLQGLSATNDEMFDFLSVEYEFWRGGEYHYSTFQDISNVIAYIKKIHNDANPGAYNV